MPQFGYSVKVFQENFFADGFAAGGFLDGMASRDGLRAARAAL
jgi:hypothetical protein